MKSISTGIFGYPVDRCSRIMTRTVRTFSQQHSSVELVIFCLFGDDAMRAFREALAEEVS